MNSFSSKLVAVRSWLWAGLFLVAGVAQAFPPVPDHVIYGVVRTEMGDPMDGANVVVVLETDSGVRVTTALVSNLQPGINYRLRVPMDAGLTADPYLPTALHPTVPFRIKVISGSTVFLPIQMQGDYARLGKPAESTRLDLTLGVDSSGDGIPDAWKQMIVGMSRGVYTNISQIRPDGHFPGNPMSFREAYIAGTYPWDLKDGFALKVISLNGDTPVMEFTAIQGRSYGVFGSVDLSRWSQVPFRIVSEGATNGLVSDYQASDVRPLRVEVPPQPGLATNRFFKVMVQ